MLYNSFEYFIFFTTLLVVYWSSPHRFRNHILIVASLLFYAYWSPIFLLHYCGILAVNYPLLKAIIEKKSKKAFVAALIFDFTNLAFFKYFYFLIRSIEAVLPAGMFPVLSQVTPDNGDILPVIILPLAISFYTFQIVAFHIDAYRGEVTETPAFWKYFLFISYFPQHIAGPIIRHYHLLGELDIPRDAGKVDVERGLALIGIGLFKKVIIADTFARLVGTVTMAPEQYESAHVILAHVCVAIMIYCDFSGYSDIARGSSTLLGFELPVNFRGPLYQLSYQEHWQRWHITLSFWLRDYLYFPLGGSRKGKIRSHLNLILTFIFAGLWHGAGPGFVIWGFFVGLLLVSERILRDIGVLNLERTWGRKEGEAAGAFAWRSTTNFLRMLSVLACVVLGAPFFNSGLDLDRALRNLTGFFVESADAKLFPITSFHGFVFLAFLFLHWLEYLDYKPILSRREKFKKFEIPALVVGGIVLLFLFSWKASGNTTFVYFQF